MRKRRLDRVVRLCLVALALGGLERGVLAQGETGLDAAPGVVHEAVESIVRVEWTLADGTRKTRAGYVDGRGYVVSILPMGRPLASAVVVDSAGGEHSVVGVAAMTRMSGLYLQYRAHGCLEVDWNGAAPRGLGLIEALPEVGADAHLIRPGGPGGVGADVNARIQVRPLQVYDNETDYVRFVARCTDVMDTAALAECLVIMSDGRIAGFLCGSERQLPMFPLRPEMVANVALYGARVLVEIPESDLPLNGMGWEEFKAYVEGVSALKREIEELESILEENAGAAMLRAREVALEYAEHPAAWVMLWKCSKEAGEEAAAVLALERAADYDPYDRTLVLRLCRAYGSQEWPRKPDGDQLEKVFGWASVSLDANWYIFVRLWQSGAYDRARERLDRAIRLAPNNPHYRTELKRLYGDAAATQPGVEQTTRESGVDAQRELPFKVLFEPDNEMFPASWRGDRHKVTAAPTGLREIALDTLGVACAKYPKQVLDQLEVVYILGDMSFEGLTFGATRSARRLYIATSGLSPSTTPYVVEFRFHGELSSVLAWKHSHLFDERGWREANPPGFAYLGSGTAAVASGRTSLSWNADSVTDAFLCEYSKSSIDNDFDIVVASLFLGRTDLWRVYDRLPAIRTKVDLAIEFYQKLDPRFTESYFRRLAGER